METPSTSLPRPERATPDAQSRLPPLVGTLAARILGVILLLAAVAKALDPRLFALDVAELVPVPAVVAHALALATIAFEAALGAALLGGSRHRAVLTITNATFVVFVAVVTWQLFQGDGGTRCGCFGALLERTPGQALAEDLAFVSLSGLAWLGRTARSATLPWRLATAAAASAIGLATTAPALPLDDRVTALAPGVTVAATGLDEVVPEIREGRHLVVLLDRAHADTPATVARLNERMRLPGGKTPVWGVADDDPELAVAFLWAAGPAFEVRSTPARMLRTLYRTLPRSALVDGGRVIATWNGVPPDAAMDRLAGGELP